MSILPSIPARRFILWTAALALSGAGFCFLPLFHLLGYEFSVGMGFLAGIAAGHLGVGVVAQARKFGRAEGIGVLFGKAWTLGILGLILPLAFISLNALRVHNCDYLEGLAFYGLIPVVSIAYGAAAGTFFGLLTRKSWRGTFAWVGWILGTLGLVLYNVLAHPAKFAYHPLFGFVAGPIYDEAVTISPALLLARGFALLTAACFLTVGWATHDPFLQRLTPKAIFYGQPPRRVAWCLAVLSLLTLGVGWGFGGRLSIRPSRGDIQRALVGRVETTHFILHFERGSSVERSISLFADDAEFRYHQLRQFFGFDVPGKIGVYVFTTPEQKKRWMGAKDTAMADPFNRELHLNADEFPNRFLKHELAHVFAAEFHPILKLSVSVGLLEGIATAAEWDEGRLTAHQWAKAMKELDMLPSFERVFSLAGFWSQSSSRAYTTAGSFVRWLVEEYGMGAFKEVYGSGNFQKVYGKSLDRLKTEWMLHLDGISLSETDLQEARRRFSRKSLLQQPCLHEIGNLEEEGWKRYGVEDFAGSRTLFERISRLDPQNAQWQWRVLQTRIAEKDWATILKDAKALIENKNADETVKLSAQEALGDAEWRTLDDAAARRTFGAVLSAASSPETRRRVAIKLDAIPKMPFLNAAAARKGMSLIAATKLIQSYFEPGRADLRLYRIREVTLLAPDWACGYYLLGRALFQAEEWESAITALRTAERIHLPEDEIAREYRRVRGEASYRSGDWNAAAEAFQEAARRAATEGERLQALDWAERAEWRGRGVER